MNDPSHTQPVPSSSHARSRTRLRAVAVLVLASLTVASTAEARHRGRSRSVRVVPVGVASPFLYGYGFYGPWASPWYRGWGPTVREGSLSPAVARAMDLGALDLNVKPRKAEVWVDGAYYGLARDFDGVPDFLWLDAGEHELSIRAPGYEPYEQTFTTPSGVVADLKVRLTERPFGQSD